MLQWAKTVVPALTIAAMAIPFGMTQDARAQSGETVVLESPDGQISISGVLLSYESEVFIIDSPESGIVKIEGELVKCISGACPAGTGPEAPSVAATPPVEGDNWQFGIHGSRTVGTILMPNLLRGFAEARGASFEMQLTPDPAERIVRLTKSDGELLAEIQLHTRGSGSGFTSLASGDALIGMADRRMNDRDLAVLRGAGIQELRNTANEHVVGVDGIVLITHPNNPVRDLTEAEIAGIFSGQITNWRAVGGPDLAISVQSFGQSSGDRAILLDAMVRPTGRDETPNVTIWSAYQDMVDAVASEPGAIGYVGRWLARSNAVNQITIRQSCGLLSPPTDFQMKIEGYALSRRIYLYTAPTSLGGVARDFVEWVDSPEAQPWIRRSNFVDNEVDRMPLQDMGMGLIHTAVVEPDFSPAQYVDMLRALRFADRLSVSLRFNFGSSRLDAESIVNMRRLAERITRGDYDGLEILLVGFADAIGNQARNTELAQQRANSVRTILAEQLGSDVLRRANINTLSYGELLPIACNGDEAGRTRNRRVEVWLRDPTRQLIGR